MRRGAVLVALVGAVVAGWWFFPLRWLYHDRRPTRLGRLVNDGWAWIYGLGLLPSFAAELETQGRVSGRPRRIPVVIGEYRGEDYLVSMLGERSGWVPNIRAAGGRAVLKHRGERPVHLIEVPATERAPIIKAYLRRAPGARPHIAVHHDAPVEEFDAIAPLHPVFRVEYIRA